jgi:hypothetical protein
LVQLSKEALDDEFVNHNAFILNNSFMNGAASSMMAKEFEITGSKYYYSDF